MKYSFMSFSCPDLTLTEMLEAAEKFGYGGLEPRIDAGHAHGIETSLTPAEKKAVRQQVADRPRRTLLSGFFGPFCRSCHQPQSSGFCPA